MCSDGREMYKKAWCACKVVVLLIWAIAFFCRSRCCSRHLRCLSSLLQPYLRLSLRRRNRTNSRLKNLTGHFVLAEPFNIFALGSRKTDEPAWILTLAFFSSCSFTICPCTERYFSKSEMTSPNWTATHPRNHASQRAGQIFDRTSKKFDLHFGG